MLSDTILGIYLFVYLSHWTIPSARAGALSSCSLLGPEAEPMTGPSGGLGRGGVCDTFESECPSTGAAVTQFC